MPNPNIRVEITDLSEFHCFRVALKSRDGHEIEIMLHATDLVDLVHKASMALCQWQKETSAHLLSLLIIGSGKTDPSIQSPASHPDPDPGAQGGQ